MVLPPLTAHPLDPDFTSGDFHRDPYTRYAGYRRDTPVFRNRDGVVYLSRHRDCELLLTDKRFCRQPPGGGGLNPFKPGKQAPDAFDLMVGHWLIFMDPPRHDVVRQAFSAPFAAKSIRSFEPAIRSVVRHLLDDLREKATVELVCAFASPLPILVLCEMFGIPRADWTRFSDWSAQITRAMDSGAPDEMRAAIPASIEIHDYFTDLLRSRSTSPRDDLLGQVMAAGKAGGLTADELVYGFGFLLLAGHETTKNLIASGVLLLAQHPDHADQLRRQPEGIATAVEELLRFESPFQKFSRWTAAPASFGEYRVAEGTLVTALIGAANRDPAVFAEPERFDIRRAPNRHLAFGRGVHACLGSALARAESRSAFDGLLATFPRIRAVEHGWRPTSALRALERLTLAFD